MHLKTEKHLWVFGCFLCIRCIMKNILTLKGGLKMDAIVNRLAEIESAAATIVNMQRILAEEKG